MVITQDTVALTTEQRNKLIAKFKIFINMYRDELINMTELYKHINIYGRMKYFSDVKGEIIAIISINGEKEPLKIKL